MTNFVHEPYKTIHIRDIIKLSLDDLISMISSLGAANAYWADGVLFVSFAIAESDDLGKKEIEGETYLDKTLYFANMTNIPRLQNHPPILKSTC